MGALSLPNARAEIGPKRRNNEQREGVSGLKSLGVRELTYKTAFLACSVTATSLRVSEINNMKEAKCIFLKRKENKYLFDWGFIFPL